MTLLNKKIEELEERIKTLEERQPIINIYTNPLPTQPLTPLVPGDNPYPFWTNPVTCLTFGSK